MVTMRGMTWWALKIQRIYEVLMHKMRFLFYFKTLDSLDIAELK